MTKKMLTVALMAGSVLVLAGCNNTPTEPVNTPVVDEEIVVIPVEDDVVDAEISSEEDVMAEVIEEEMLEPVVVEQPVEIIVAE